MTRDSVFEILKDDNNVKITIALKTKILTLHKQHDTFYLIYINYEKKYTITNIVSAVDTFIAELNKTKEEKK